jgi:hypothetical protein
MFEVKFWMGEVPPIGTWAPREKRYIAEWANERFPSAKKRFNVALGPVPQSAIEELGFEKAVRMFRRWRPFVDCIIFLPEKIIMAEAEIINPKNAIGDLLYYRTIAPETPDLPELKTSKLEYWLVIPEHLKWIEDLCKKQDIVVDIYTPEWIKSYLEQFRKYWTSEEILKRQIRKRRREEL